MGEEVLEYGSRVIRFRLEYTNRKTLGITVNPDLSVVVKAPLDANREKIFERIEKRAAWIVRQQQYFKSFEKEETHHLYKTGESHYYLGRRYQLKIVDSVHNEVSYKGRYLQIDTKNREPEHIATLLDEWYRERAKVKFAEYAEPLITRFKNRYDVEPNELYIKKMDTRWGSCTDGGNVILNPNLIKAPKACIEYVIVHELCHLIHRNHTKAYYRLLMQEMPDWQKWKNRLEEFSGW